MYSDEELLDIKGDILYGDGFLFTDYKCYIPDLVDEILRLRELTKYLSNKLIENNIEVIKGHNYYV